MGSANKDVCNTDWIEKALGRGAPSDEYLCFQVCCSMPWSPLSPCANVSSTSPQQQAPFVPKLCAYVSKTNHQPYYAGGKAQLRSLCLNLLPSQHRRETAHQEWSLAHCYPWNHVQTLLERTLMCTGQNSATRYARDLKDVQKRYRGYTESFMDIVV